MYDNISDAIRASANSGEVEFSLFPGETARLMFDIGNVRGEELQHATTQAEQTLLLLQHKQQYLRDAIAKEYLEEYNEICHHQKPESKEEFLDKIYLDSVTIGTGISSVSLNYLHEDLDHFFGDHAIAVYLNSNLEVESMDTVG